MAFIRFRQSSLSSSLSSDIAAEPCLEHFVSKAKCGVGLFVGLLAEHLSQVAGTRSKGFYPIAAWQRAPTRHVLFRWRANEIKDDVQLVQVAGASEYRFPLEHLTENAAASG